MIAGLAAVLLLVAVGGLWQVFVRLAVPPVPPVEKASLRKEVFAPPDRVSVAVLPFQNMTGDPQQEYFGEGMAEQIIAGLSQTPDIYVSARTSSFAFKGKPITAQQIAEQLGVRYLLEGSVQRDAARVRINIQLIDGRDGRHIWAKRYDDLLEDLFALQDRITMEVMEALNVQFIPGITETNLSINLKQYRPSSLRAYEAYLKGVNLFFRRTIADSHSRPQAVRGGSRPGPQFCRSIPKPGVFLFGRLLVPPDRHPGEVGQDGRAGSREIQRPEPRSATAARLAEHDPLSQKRFC